MEHDAGGFIFSPVLDPILGMVLAVRPRTFHLAELQFDGEVRSNLRGSHHWAKRSNPRLFGPITAGDYQKCHSNNAI